MGKYIKKSKIAGDVALMDTDLSPHSYIGVRTRAKTLALQHNHHPNASSFSYLQLRSRRLQKVVLDPRQHHPPPPQELPMTECCDVAVNSRPRERSVKSLSPVDGKEAFFDREIAKESEAEENLDVGIEGSFGENVLESEGRDRSTRESTPCSLIRDSNAIDTPGSTTRQRTSSFGNQIIHEQMQRNIPTVDEIEEFFAYVEKHQQTKFMEKYNFDFVNDVPLRGRYEWVQVLH